MFEPRRPKAGGPKLRLRRPLHMQNVGSGIPKFSLRQSLNLARSPESKLFFRLVKSPGHVLFLATNVAVLVHLKLLSTMKQKHRIDHLSSQAAELEDYENVISDLDSKLDGVQKQIQELKARKSTKKTQRSTDSDDSSSAISKQLKRMRVQQTMLADQESLAQKFVQSRESIAAAASLPENIAKLFASSSLKTAPKTTESDTKDYTESDTKNPKKPTKNPTTTHKKTRTDIPRVGFEHKPSQRTYSAPIQNSLMSLSHSIIMTSLIELNIRHALFDKTLKRLYPNSDSVYRQGLFEHMYNDEDKKELLLEMSNIRTHDFQAKPFSKQLDSKKTERLLERLSKSDHFSSKESRRHDMYINKSGHWRNYENSDTAKEILANRGPIFHSTTVNNDDYFAKFQDLFSSYHTERRPFKHLDLVLKIARILVSDGKGIPSNAIFRDLLDKFGQAGLKTYQSLVYDLLPPFQHRKTAWADGVAPNAFAEKKVFHFQSLIEEDPQLLGSLIEYNRTRGNVSFVKKLFSFLEPVTDIHPSNQTVLPKFMTKHVGSGSNEVLDKPILFKKNIIELAIKACVDLKQYKSLDQLVNTLVFNSIETPGGLRIFSGSGCGSDQLILNNFPTEEVVSKLFNENILCMLGQAYVSSKDLRRCEWIAPLIQNYITKKNSPKLNSLYSSILHLLESTHNMEHAQTVRDQGTPKKFEHSIGKLNSPAFEEPLTHNHMASLTT